MTGRLSIRHVYKPALTLAVTKIHIRIYYYYNPLGPAIWPYDGIRFFFFFSPFFYTYAFRLSRRPYKEEKERQQQPINREIRRCPKKHAIRLYYTHGRVYLNNLRPFVISTETISLTGHTNILYGRTTRVRFHAFQRVYKYKTVFCTADCVSENVFYSRFC